MQCYSLFGFSVRSAAPNAMWPAARTACCGITVHSSASETAAYHRNGVSITSYAMFSPGEDGCRRKSPQEILLLGSLDHCAVFVCARLRCSINQLTGVPASSLKAAFLKRRPALPALCVVGSVGRGRSWASRYVGNVDMPFGILCFSPRLVTCKSCGVAGGPSWIMTSGRHHGWSCPRYSYSDASQMHFEGFKGSPRSHAKSS